MLRPLDGNATNLHFFSLQTLKRFPIFFPQITTEMENTLLKDLNKSALDSLKVEVCGNKVKKNDSALAGEVSARGFDCDTDDRTQPKSLESKLQS